MDWSFTECFQTWDCNSECSLQYDPPLCIKMKVHNWGRYTPMLGGVCSYGEDGSENQEDDSAGQDLPGQEDAPGQADDQDDEMERDSTWCPVY